jgi:hypothetical protein
MSLSFCESEIHATNEGTKSALNVCNLLLDLNEIKASDPVPIWNDNRIIQEIKGKRRGIVRNYMDFFFCHVACFLLLLFYLFVGVVGVFLLV